MWPLDSLTKLSTNVSSNLQKAMKEGFGPVANIASTIGNTIGTVTGTINESKALAEQEAKKNVVENKEKKETNSDTSSNIDASNNEVAPEKPMSETEYALMIVKYIFVAVFTFYFAMLTVNQLVFEPAAYRIIIFIFICLIPIIFSPAAIIPIGIYYTGLLLWRLYLRSTPEYKNKTITLLPRIYCMLPLTSVEGTNSFVRFFKYPFYFPKTDKSQENIKKYQQAYENELMDSFYKWNEITKKYPEFGNQFKLLSQQFSKLITRVPAPEPPKPVESTPTGKEVNAAGQAAASILGITASTKPSAEETAATTLGITAQK
jgi:hypothetical protein